MTSSLAARGMIAVAGDPLEADYVLRIAYGIGDGETITSAVPLIGQTGGGTTYQTGTVNTYTPYGSATSTYSGTAYTPATFGVVGSVPVTNTVYTRTLEIGLIDMRQSQDRERAPTFAYKGRAVSTGSSASFMAVSKCMIDAIMTDFPGISGTTAAFDTESGKCVR